MKTRIDVARVVVLAFALMGVTLALVQTAGAATQAAPTRPKGPCDIYATAGDPCVAAHSTNRSSESGSR